MSIEIILGLIIITLIGVIVFQMVQFDKKEKIMLDRIMARTFEEFVQAEIVRKQDGSLTPEEIYEQQIERGIPV